MALLLGVYALLTRPAALRSYLTSALQPTGLRVTEGSSVWFTPWTGLVVTELELFSLNAARDVPPLVHITRATIPVHIGSLLTGHLSLASIAAEGVVITLVAADESISTEVEPSATQPAGSSSQPDGGDYRRRVVTLGLPTNLPPVEIAVADVQIMEREADRLILRHRSVVSLSGRPESDAGQGKAYAVTLRTAVIGQSPAAGAAHPALATMRWTRDTMSASTDWVDAGTIGPFLPAAIQEHLRFWGIDGQARLSACEIQAGRVESLKLEIAGATASIPVEADDVGIPPGSRYLRFTDVQAALQLIPAAIVASGSPRGTTQGEVLLELGGQFRSGQVHARIRAQQAHLQLARLIGGDTTLDDAVGCGAFDAQISFDDFEAPTLERFPHFVRSAQLPDAIRSFIADYKPRGKLSLSFNISGPSSDKMLDESALQVSGRMEPRGASCRYFRFPYEVHDIWGLVSFDDKGIEVEHLIGRHGCGVITGRGHVIDSSPWTGFDLVFEAANIVMDRDIYEALTPSYRKLWQEADPLGLSDLRVDISRLQGSRELGSLDPTVHIDTHMTAATLSVMNDTTLERVEGRFRVGDNDIRIENLRGFQGSTGVTLNGTIDIPNGIDPPGRAALFLATDVPVSRNSTITHTDGSELGRVHFAGKADVWGRVSGASGALEPVYAAHVTDGRLIGFDPNLGWGNASGWIMAGPQGERILTLAARRPEGHIELAGDLPGGADGPPQSMQVDAEDDAFETLLPQLIPARWAELHQTLNAGGKGRLAVSVKQAPGKQTPAADVSIEVARMKPRALPLGLHNVRAELTIDADGYLLRSARASGDEAGEVTGNGRGVWGADQTSSEWTIACSGFDCTPNFVKAMPTTLANLLRRTNLKGKLDLVLNPVRLTQQGSDELWSFDGVVKLHDATAELGMPMTIGTGELRGSVVLDASGDAAIDAKINVETGSFGGRALRNLTGQLVHGANDRWIQLTELRGLLSEGDANAEVKVDGNSGDYEATLKFRNAQLAEFLNRPAKPGQPPSTGVVDGNLWLRGVGEDRRGQRGGGRLMVRNASLLSTPVSAAIVKAGQQSRKQVNPAVDDAELDLAWEGDDFHFRRVLIMSRDQKLLGEGDWNQKTDRISATLYSLPPKAPAALEPLVKLFQAAGDELFQVRIEGTSNEPKGRVEALYGLTEPLKRLLNSENREGPR